MKIKVGFEYETLVYVPEWDSFEQLCKRIHAQINPSSPFTGIKTLHNSTNDESIVETNCDTYADIEGDILVRFVLAAIYHRMQTKRIQKIPFNVQKHYHGATCTALPLDVNAFIMQQSSANVNTGSRASAWNITPDNSVVWCKKYNQQSIEKDCPLVVYESLEKYVLHNKYKSIADISPSKVLEKIEVVSPPLELQDIKIGILHLINKIMNANDKFVYINNEKTSNHVHMSFDDGTANILLTSPEALLKVCIGWWYFEPIFMLLCGHWRRSNMYAEGMRDIIYNYFMDPLVGKRMMERIDTETFLDELHDIDLLNDEDLMFMGDDEFSEKLYIQTIMNSIISLFQGDIRDDTSRYAALNMLNMTNNGIGTIEIRIKQGSNDARENTAFILLLTDFFKNIIQNPVVTRRYMIEKNAVSEDIQKKVLEDSWRLWDEFLCKNKAPSLRSLEKIWRRPFNQKSVNSKNNVRVPNVWEQSTSLAHHFKENPEYWSIALNMFNELMEYIDNPEVKTYWTHVFTHLHDPSRVGGGKRSKK